MWALEPVLGSMKAQEHLNRCARLVDQLQDELQAAQEAEATEDGSERSQEIGALTEQCTQLRWAIGDCGGEIV